ncbi:hypothetical protein GCM10011607_28710 [Shewanella inventionis]|uniref:Uncharacterized protein n=1 Tax=Shewanella inventionis TaxID=1738770 RepID=A0ABQ1JHR5_9GAMM|nr:hypothetical protein [Shewanella inventionis]GGB66316.1 hypothetical protein GCM10011607_28710 [Shewanella inventionis]
MTSEKKVSLRVLLSSSRKEEVAFIEHLASLRKMKNHYLPNYVLQLAMLGLKAKDSNGFNTLSGGIDSAAKPQINIEEMQLELTDSQLQFLAKNIATEMKRLNITDGVRSILSENVSDQSNHIEEVGDDFENEELKGLKGSSFF